VNASSIRPSLGRPLGSKPNQALEADTQIMISAPESRGGDHGGAVLAE
jgi:hypothetical protein